MNKKPDDATKIAGLASILQGSNKQKEIPPSPAPSLSAAVESPARPVATKGKKERIGKNRDPNYHQCGLYIRKATHKRARRKLEDTRPDTDMSDLVEELLQQWLASV